MLNRALRADPLSFAEFGASLAALGPFESPPFLAAAVSGGPDSVALALLADRWSRERGGEICALTVDHQLRPESGAEARMVHTWLAARGIRHEVLEWQGEKPNTGIQEAARAARYRLLAGWCHDSGCLHLLTAHHREDQIETHLIRRRAHSGTDGLAGMPAIRELADCRLLRPLLAISRLRLRAFLEAEGQSFISDPSNFDPAFERSRFRDGGSAIPSAADTPRLLAAISDFGALRAERQRDTEAVLAHFVRLHPAGFACLDPDICEQGEIAERALSAIVATIGGADYPPRRERIIRLRDVLASGLRRGHSLGGCRFAVWRGQILVMRELARAAPPIRLEGGMRTGWDRRYEVALSAPLSHPLTIGYLGQAGAAQLRRLKALPTGAFLPRLLLPHLPAAWDEDGIAAVPHLGYGREGTAGLPEFVFRPVNWLTRAGFAVV